MRNVMAVAVMFLAGCLNAAAPEKTTHPDDALNGQGIRKTFVYECSNAYSFVARIEDKTVWLFLPQKTLSLPEIPSGSGAKYSDGLMTFWTKGDTALLETQNASYRNCINNRARAIWEHAKLNGVDFRAVGNEPGWYLEINAGDKIVFVDDYGATRYEVNAPEPLTNQQKRRTIYQTDIDGKTLTVVLEGRRCRDSMSGESFQTTVRVTLDQKSYQGCGRALH